MAGPIRDGEDDGGVNGEPDLDRRLVIPAVRRNGRGLAVTVNGPHFRAFLPLGTDKAAPTTLAAISGKALL